MRNRLKPVALCGDLKQAFLQIRIREEDRDALRFHWINNKDPAQIEVLRFTRALFGLVQSPFLLGATIEEHLSSSEGNHPAEVAEIRRSLYVDDVISGASTVEEAQHLKNVAVSVFGEANFELHKWHSNAAELETDRVEKDADQSYAKEQLGVLANETKMLGLAWNKTEDSLGVTFPAKQAELTKRGILRNLASIYDPLGFASPVTLLGKFVYRECCDEHLTWDTELPENIERQWMSFEKNLPTVIEVPRSLCFFQEPIRAVDLHVFGDTSGKGTSAVVYAVIIQDSGISQGLLAAKARLAKKNMSIPRLELVSAHMAANLVANVKDALQGFPIGDIYGWLDSSVALHWIKGNGNYKQFVANRVKLITEKNYIIWRHVRTSDNPADIGSRGEKASKLSEVWLNGPKWLSERSCWPEELQLQPSTELEAEAKLLRTVLAVSVESTDQINNLISKFNFWKTIRITAYCRRFVRNCKAKRADRLQGPLTTEEIQGAIQNWVIKTQGIYKDGETFKEDQLRLNLQVNAKGVYECRGRIQGDYPIYLPPQAEFTARVVADAHTQTLHGGVGLTMAWIRRTYWIPRLRQLTKEIIKGCYGCKRFHAIAYGAPPEGNLPKDRTEGERPFQVIGVDYAGPIAYKQRTKEGKAYILLYSCSLTRAIHLELLPNQTTEEFLMSLKRFIARRGRPEKIYSDNGKTFVAGAKWLKRVTKDEALQNTLARQSIRWQFNLSRAPWWGGQFERMVGLVKQSLYKTIGRASLRWNELSEVRHRSCSQQSAFKLR